MTILYIIIKVIVRSYQIHNSIIYILIVALYDKPVIYD